jgi:hypothetical protein
VAVSLADKAVFVDRRTETPTTKVAGQ